MPHSRAEQELDSNARPVFTFLESYDLSGKTIVPFCTSGSSGVEPSVTDIRQSCPDSTVLDGRRVNDTGSIEGWLSSLGLIGNCQEWIQTHADTAENSGIKR